MSGVTAILSKKSLEFTPNNPLEPSESSSDGENLFDVTVVNDSDKFASFQLELSALGVDENSHIKWYCVEPEICAKTPPGSETKFQIAITKAPIPAYDTNIDLELDVFSVEDEKLKTKKNLKLRINRPLKSLQVEMPVKRFRVEPDYSIEIPVLVYNLSPKFSEITLTCLQLNPEWMKETQTRLQLEPGDSQNINFLCQPPKGTASKEYEFSIEAKSNISHYSPREQGILEVLPNGNVEFSCTEKNKIIPEKKRNKSQKADYELVFWNDSNLPQHVDIIAPEKDKKRCEIIIPEGINIAPKETGTMHLLAEAKRHRIGKRKIRKFAVSAVLSNPASGEPCKEISPKPNTVILELTILPIIPFLLQLGGAILIPLLLLLGWMYSQKPVYHQGSVNSVKFFGNGSLVFSGSSDQTIRRWQVEDSGGIFTSAEVEDKGIVAELNKAVRVIRQSPKDDDVIAVGLENGEIKLWDIASLNKEKETDFTYDNLSRVFDLVFSRNGRYLYSGHANRTVKQWNLETDSKENSELDNEENIESDTNNSVNKLNNQDEKRNKSKKVNFAVYALAINENIPNNPLVIIAGRYNKIEVWQPEKNRINPLPYNYNKSIRIINETKVFDPVMGQQHYITSLTSFKNILASADNKGYITLWDINKIRNCIDASTDEKNAENGEKEDNNNNNNKSVFCNEAITEQWRDGHDKQPVRSVALTKSGCYLASAGDDGKVMLWSLSKGKRKENSREGEAAFNDSNTKFNTVDIKALKDDNGEYVLITSGDDNYQVRIKKISEGIDNNASCQ
jgi:WD40 repeat protein